MSGVTQYFLLGSSGLLGSQLSKSYGESIKSIAPEVYLPWAEPGGSEQVFKYFSSIQMPQAVIFVACGITNPSLHEDELIRANYWLPKNIVEGVKTLGSRVITFGTIMEVLSPDLTPYVRSKAMLRGYLAGLPKPSPHLHIQIHTLFGERKPHPHMFLGGIFQALMTNTEFCMSEGKQLREYHHVEDLVNAVITLENFGTTGELAISSEEPIMLADLAFSIFQYFGADDLLKVGALDTSVDEVTTIEIRRPSEIADCVFRDPIANIGPCLWNLIHGAANESNR